MSDVKPSRVIVSAARHKKLSLEADKRGLTLEQVAEEKFVTAEKYKNLIAE